MIKHTTHRLWWLVTKGCRYGQLAPQLLQYMPTTNIWAYIFLRWYDWMPKHSGKVNSVVGWGMAIHNLLLTLNVLIDSVKQSIDGHSLRFPHLAFPSWPTRRQEMYSSRANQGWGAPPTHSAPSPPPATCQVEAHRADFLDPICGCIN